MIVPMTEARSAMFYLATLGRNDAVPRCHRSLERGESTVELHKATDK